MEVGTYVCRLDEKWRLNIPKEIQDYFNGVVHGLLGACTMQISNTTFDGIGVFERNLDKSGRLPIGEDLLKIVGVPDDDPKKHQVIIIAQRVQGRLSFILYFGQAGEYYMRAKLDLQNAILSSQQTPFHSHQ